MKNFKCFLILNILLIVGCSKKANISGTAYLTFGAGDVKTISGEEVMLISENIFEKIDSLKRKSEKIVENLSMDDFEQRYDSLKNIVDGYNKLTSVASNDEKKAIAELIKKSVSVIKKDRIEIEIPKYSSDELKIILGPRRSRDTPESDVIYTFGEGNWIFKNCSEKNIGRVTFKVLHNSKKIGSIGIPCFKESERSYWSPQEEFIINEIFNSVYLSDDFKITDDILKDFQSHGIKHIDLISTDIYGSKYDIITDEFDYVYNIDEIFPKDIEEIRKKSRIKIDRFLKMHNNINDIIK